jgi:DNA/RNA-binding domain of Phe-tRNA-synthetase-like protein
MAGAVAPGRVHGSDFSQFAATPATGLTRERSRGQAPGGAVLSPDPEKSVNTIEQVAHPTLRVRAFDTSFPRPLREMAKGPASDLLRADATAPLQRDEPLRQAVRDMLRHWGYKPTGRGKPASEYLVRAAEEGSLDAINVAVDACNAVSLHSGFPISVVDVDRVAGPLRIAPGGAGDRYVFNAAGQEIDVAGLACLWDDAGPCANAVKDAQRTKTSGDTTRTLSIIWGVAGYEDRLDDAVAWYRSLLAQIGAWTVIRTVTLTD